VFDACQIMQCRLRKPALHFMHLSDSAGEWNPALHDTHSFKV
jgi:hypothetical protein